MSNRLPSFLWLLTLAVGLADPGECYGDAPDAAKPEVETGSEIEKSFLSNVRQLTFEGRRAGEGYFSADGKRMVFQSERDAENPFYQIYLSDLETGDIEKVWANTDKINKVLGWEAKFTLEDSMRDSWNWQVKLGKK